MRPESLSLIYENKPILQGFEQFAFRKNGFKPQLSNKNREFIQKLSEFLSISSEVNIVLTGRLLESEKTANSGIYENIGIARAVAIEQMLVETGLNEKRISIDYEAMKGDVLEEPVSFELYRTESGAATPSAGLQFSFLDNTFSDTNFEINSDVFKPGPQCLVYADSVVKYLLKNPEMYLSIVGHTDTLGGEEYNFELGLKRAQSAAKYFQSKGVTSPIEVTSKGEIQPIVMTGDSLQMKKNRRVNFKIRQRVMK
jgi:outer membrane protein OmpA-like peptidoglycan-associated protein